MSLVESIAHEKPSISITKASNDFCYETVTLPVFCLCVSPQVLRSLRLMELNTDWVQSWRYGMMREAFISLQDNLRGFKLTYVYPILKCHHMIILAKVCIGPNNLLQNY